MARGRGDASFTLMAGVLFALVAVAVGLFVLLARGPGSAATQMSTPQSVECPAGSHAPVCYRVTIRNSGSQAAIFSCRVLAQQGTTAVFASSGTAVDSTSPDAPLQPGDIFIETAQITPDHGTSVTGPPQIGCQPVA
jgi:hypothetical protein